MFNWLKRIFDKNANHRVLVVSIVPFTRKEWIVDRYSRKIPYSEVEKSYMRTTVKVIEPVPGAVKIKLKDTLFEKKEERQSVPYKVGDTFVTDLGDRLDWEQC